MTGPERPQDKRFTVADILETVFEGTTTEAVLTPFQHLQARFSKHTIRAKKYTARLSTLREATNNLYRRGMSEEDTLLVLNLVQETIVKRMNSIARDYIIRKTSGQQTGAVNVHDYHASPAYYLGLTIIIPNVYILPDLPTIKNMRGEIGRILQDHMDQFPGSFIVHPRPKPTLNLSRTPAIKPPKL